MDPAELLRRIERLANSVRSSNYNFDAGDVEELAHALNDLHDWASRGGFLPVDVTHRQLMLGKIDAAQRAARSLLNTSGRQLSNRRVAAMENAARAVVECWHEHSPRTGVRSGFTSYVPPPATRFSADPMALLRSLNQAVQATHADIEHASRRERQALVTVRQATQLRARAQDVCSWWFNGGSLPGVDRRSALGHQLVAEMDDVCHDISRASEQMDKELAAYRERFTPHPDWTEVMAVQWVKPLLDACDGLFHWWNEKVSPLDFDPGVRSARRSYGRSSVGGVMSREQKQRRFAPQGAADPRSSVPALSQWRAYRAFAWSKCDSYQTSCQKDGRELVFTITGEPRAGDGCEFYALFVYDSHTRMYCLVDVHGACSVFPSHGVAAQPSTTHPIPRAARFHSARDAHSAAKRFLQHGVLSESAGHGARGGMRDHGERRSYDGNIFYKPGGFALLRPEVLQRLRTHRRYEVGFSNMPKGREMLRAFDATGAPYSDGIPRDGKKHRIYSPEAMVQVLETWWGDEARYDDASAILETLGIELI